MNRDEIIARVNEAQWYQRFEILPGIVTPGIIDAPLRWSLLKLPESFEGKEVLDVGCSSGYFSFEMEKRGAKRVVAIDVASAEMSGFALAAEILESTVEFSQASVYDITPERFGTFDIVLFLGCLYHLRHPLLALELLYQVCKDYMILETHVCDKELEEYSSKQSSSFPFF